MKERVCLDTSFLVNLLAGNSVAIDIWKEVAEMKVEPVISAIVLFEIKRLSLKEEFERDKYEKLEEALLEIADVIDLDRYLALKAAAVSHGTGLAARDAIIYTTAREAGCSKLYTADSDFKAVSGKKLKIKFV